jgi:acetyl esterase/lipase
MNAGRAFPLALAAALAAPAAARGQAAGAAPASAYKSAPVDTAHGDRPFVLLWPDGAPGALGTNPEDKPKLTLYPAPADRDTGAAAVVLPGGSYRTLGSDREGKQVARWLNSIGLSAFVLQYRVGPRYRHPVPLQDAQRALRLVRAGKARVRVDPGRLGIVGFSAGGHLASTTGTRFDAGQPDSPDPIERVSSRPDFMVLGYPVISMSAPFAHRNSLTSLLGESPDAALLQELSSETKVRPDTPPTFLFHTADDPGVHVENSLAFFRALREAKVPAELHVFEHGTHGVGLAAHDPALSVWPSLCAAWLEAHISKPSRAATPAAARD